MTTTPPERSERLPLQPEESINLQELIANKLKLLAELDQYLDRPEPPTKVESLQLANQIAVLFPRDDEQSYRSEKQLLFDDFFALAYEEYPPIRLAETKTRISDFRDQLQNLTETVMSAQVGLFSMGQIVLDVQAGTVHLVIGVKSSNNPSAQELLLLSWEGIESIVPSKQVTLSPDVNDYVFFMQQICMHWRVYGKHNIISAWNEYTADLEEEHGYFLQKRASHPFTIAYQTWSLLNTAVRKFSDSAR